jgi:insulysin
LTTNGGTRNAMTGEEDTMYYFDVRNDALEGALDIFSQFFITPLFLESALEREINIVESEFRKNVSN